MKRQGVSLLECMFAIGVAAVGLLGVLAIIPLGLNQIGRGNVADRSMRTGLNAVEQFDLRGMRRPDHWLYVYQLPASGPVSVVSVLSSTNTFTDANGNNMYDWGTESQASAYPYVNTQTSFCIDPRFVAVQRGQYDTASPYWDARFFPYYSPDANPAATVWPPTPLTNEPRMVRITLRDSVANQVSDTAMGVLQANKIFVDRDDLEFEIPKEKTLAPIQDIRSQTTAVNVNARPLGPGERPMEAAFSWMATVVPVADATGSAQDKYILSVVVFHKRDPRMEFYTDVDASGGWDKYDLDGDGFFEAAEPRFEKSVAVTSFPGAGFSGGDITLESGVKEDLELKKGSWVMLAGSAGVSGIELPHFRWYRVVAADSEPQKTTAGNNWEANVMLQGSDWQRTEWHLPSGNANFRPSQATIMGNVVAVYEKTIRLEHTTLWIH